MDDPEYGRDLESVERDVERGFDLYLVLLTVLTAGIVLGVMLMLIAKL